eukprot:3236460-Pyramimonas_sp.AAC.1
MSYSLLWCAAAYYVAARRCPRNTCVIEGNMHSDHGPRHRETRTHDDDIEWYNWAPGRRSSLPSS